MSEARELAAAAARAFTKPFGGVIRLEPEGAPPLFVDGREDPPAIVEAKPAETNALCVWRGAGATLMRIFDGERLLGGAYLSGRLAIAGDMSVMARLALERQRRA